MSTGSASGGARAIGEDDVALLGDLVLGELQASRQGVAIPQVAAVAGEGGVDRDDELVEQVVLDEDRVSVMPPTEMSRPRSA